MGERRSNQDTVCYGGIDASSLMLVYAIKLNVKSTSLGCAVGSQAESQLQAWASGQVGSRQQSQLSIENTEEDSFNTVLN